MRSLLLLALVLACDAQEPAGTPPDAPEMLDAAVVDGGAHLTWIDGSDDEDAFAIVRLDAAGAAQEIATVPFDTASYHDGTAGAGTWSYQVVARNDNGDSAPSNTVMVSIP